jgi:hypothetical protein
MSASSGQHWPRRGGAAPGRGARAVGVEGGKYDVMRTNTGRTRCAVEAHTLGAAIVATERRRQRGGACLSSSYDRITHLGRQERGAAGVGSGWGSQSGISDGPPEPKSAILAVQPALEQFHHLP